NSRVYYRKGDCRAMADTGVRRLAVPADHVGNDTSVTNANGRRRGASRRKASIGRATLCPRRAVGAAAGAAQGISPLDTGAIPVPVTIRASVAVAIDSGTIPVTVPAPVAVTITAIPAIPVTVEVA